VPDVEAVPGKLAARKSCARRDQRNVLFDDVVAHLTVPIGELFERFSERAAICSERWLLLLQADKHGLACAVLEVVREQTRRIAA
jgi:hypothetical protein